ncbi:unnamed protein product [Prunus brigantina]
MENYINDYVVIMDRFVNTTKDVELLVKHGIVENSLGDSSEGSTLINNLADGVIVDPVTSLLFFVQTSTSTAERLGTNGRQT